MLPLWLPDDPHIYLLTHRESRKVSLARSRTDSTAMASELSCVEESRG